jgi:hypothetical protein
MKRTIIFTIVFLLTATTAQSQNKNIEQEFMRLHRAEEEGETKKDFAVLDRFLNDDFIFVAANGSASSGLNKAGLAHNQFSRNSCAYVTGLDHELI